MNPDDLEDYKEFKRANERFFAIYVRGEDLFGDKIGREEIHGFIISTAFVKDYQKYETIIERGARMKIVEQYLDKEEAIQGHQKWKKDAPNLDFDKLIDVVFRWEEET